jgi:hypothetical protein
VLLIPNWEPSSPIRRTCADRMSSLMRSVLVGRGGSGAYLRRGLKS